MKTTLRRRAVAPALVVLLASQAAVAGPLLYSVRSDGNGHLYRIDATTGVATDLGALTDGNIEGLAFAGSTLYGLTGAFTWDLWNITTPPGSLIGSTGIPSGLDVGLGYNSATATMYAEAAGALYTVDLGTGAATAIGSAAVFLDGLAIDAGGSAFAIDAIYTDSLYSANLATGTATLVGSLGISLDNNAGLAFAGGTLYMVHDGDGIYTINTSTGAATFVVAITDSATHQTLTRFEGLAGAVPEPGTLALVGLGLLGLGLARRRVPA